MTFPQTSSVRTTTGGQEYWRLFTQLESSGDIYESDVGARAFAIGPDSDIARAQVTYIDPQEGDSVNTLSVSIDSPFVGRVDAVLDQNYPAGLPARLLISSLDLVPTPAFKAQFAGDVDFNFLQFPNIDLIQYLSEPPSFSPVRTDRKYYFLRTLAAGANQTGLVTVPYYGRRRGEVTYLFSGTTAAATLYGYNLNLIGADLASPDDMYVILQTNAAAGSGSLTTSGRPFDLLVIEFTFGASPYQMECIITTSDRL